MLSVILLLFAASSLVRIYKKVFLVIWRNAIINHMIAAALLNSVVILFSVFSIEFRDLLYSFVYVTDKASRYLTGTEVRTLRYPGPGVIRS